MGSIKTWGQQGWSEVSGGSSLPGTVRLIKKVVSYSDFVPLEGSESYSAKAPVYTLLAGETLIGSSLNTIEEFDDSGSPILALGQQGINTTFNSGLGGSIAGVSEGSIKPLVSGSGVSGENLWLVGTATSDTPIYVKATTFNFDGTRGLVEAYFWVANAAQDPTIQTVDNPHTNTQVIGPIEIRYDDPDLLTGKAIYTPTVGDVLLDAWVSVIEAWDGTTPKGDLGTFAGATAGLFDSLGGSPFILDATIWDNGGIAYPNNNAQQLSSYAAFNGSYPSAGLFSSDPLKICVSTSGTLDGFDPAATQGLAHVYLVVARPVRANNSKLLPTVTDGTTSAAAPGTIRFDGATVTNDNGAVTVAGTVLKRTVTITTEQLLDLHNTSVTLVPGAGAGKIIVPHEALLHITGTIRFSASSGLWIGYPALNFLATTDQLLGPGTASGLYQIVASTGNLWLDPASDADNAPIMFSTFSPFTDPGGADTAVKVTVFYSIIDL